MSLHQNKHVKIFYWGISCNLLLQLMAQICDLWRSNTQNIIVHWLWWQPDQCCKTACQKKNISFKLNFCLQYSSQRNAVFSNQTSWQLLAKHFLAINSKFFIQTSQYRTSLVLALSILVSLWAHSHFKTSTILVCCIYFPVLFLPSCHSEKQYCI